MQWFRKTFDSPANNSGVSFSALDDERDAKKTPGVMTTKLNVWGGEDKFAILIENILSEAECRALVERSAQTRQSNGIVGYESAKVNIGGGREMLMTDVRNNERSIVDDASLAESIWQRILSALSTSEKSITAEPPAVSLSSPHLVTSPGVKPVEANNNVLDPNHYETPSAQAQTQVASEKGTQPAQQHSNFLLADLKTKLLHAPWREPSNCTRSSPDSDSDSNSNSESDSSPRPPRWHAVGLNERLRFLRYSDRTYFAPHYDGSYLRDGRDCGGMERRGEKSFVTLLVYLNDSAEFEGGETNILCPRNLLQPISFNSDGNPATMTTAAAGADVGAAAGTDGGASEGADSEVSTGTRPCYHVYDDKISILPRPGLALLFQHDCFHEGAVLRSGSKYVIRTDVMYTGKGPGYEYSVRPLVSKAHDAVHDK